MKFKAFRIRNFRGIQETELVLNGNPGSIYTLVGLNESGKTTILEALNNFRPDVDGIHAMAQESLSPTSIESLVPKKHKHNFNDDIIIEATAQITREEVQAIADECRSEAGFQIDVDQFPLEFSAIRKHKFENSKYVKSSASLPLTFNIKRKGARKFSKTHGSSEEWQLVVGKIRKMLPRIVYFPTFLFEFPERIQVSDGESDIDGNEHFKQVIESALASLDSPLDLQTHIVDRVLKVEPDTIFGAFMQMWLQSDECEQVNASLTRLSQKISSEIFGLWKEVLGSDLGNKELIIEPDVQTGTGDERVLYLRFKVKDGYSSFKISERSLGFRWFFCFLLFTKFFQGNEKGGSIFLFDEPASNLHSKAQSKLLESLKVIADGKNDIVYSTHSHHLINPLWLETTFIVANGKPADSLTVADPDTGMEDADIKAVPYRTFVGQHAEKGHYFQPILDKLDVAPSKLEATHQGVFTEGKSDFYILNWYKMYYKPDLPLDFVPIGGATNGSALMSLYLGLCRDFVFLLDGDREGNGAKSRYLKDLPVSEGQIVQLPECLGKGFKAIENTISQDMKDAIREKYGVSRLSKKHIQRAFSETLSGSNDLPDDKATIENLEKLCNALESRLNVRRDDPKHGRG